jgi:predicted nucleic acid-binding Zn ribbon protein
MKKSLNKYIDSLVRKIINETIEERADELVTKLTESDNTVCEQCGSSSLMEGECTECGYRMNEEFYEEDGTVCEQCGGEMREGICEQCSSGSMNETDEFDYVAEEENFNSDPAGMINKFCDTSSDEYNDAACKYHEARFMGGEVSEKLHGRQSRIDVAEPKGKITGADFKKLRSMKKETDEEVEEGNAFTGALAKAKKDGDETFEVGGKKFNVRESIQMTESEMIEFIENIVLQEEKKLKSMGKTKGLNVYQKAHTASGKENKEYLQSVVKKMKDYLKDGSKGNYDMNPEIFPKGNGELAKMDKKSYQPSDAVKDYIDNFTAAALENIDYDEIHPNEDWINDNIEGSSRTGNNPKWANTGKSEVNKKRNKIRKDNMLAKVKRKAYNKSPQPIVQDTQDGEKANKILMKLESTDEKKNQKINEEFERMKNLIGYNQKTQ